MNKILLHCLAMLIAVGVTAAQTAADDARDSAVRPTKVIRLFDGKSLDGFYTWLKDTQREDPRKVFRVTDGMLHVTGDGLGGLLTNKQYRDYHSILEITARNRALSGIGEPYARVWQPTRMRCSAATSGAAAIAIHWRLVIARYSRRNARPG